MVFNHFRGRAIDHEDDLGHVEHPDGRVERMVDIVPELAYDPVNRRLRGGRVHCTMADGSTRTLQVEVVSDTGFHLGTGLYFGFDGHHHGEWRGELHVDGERIDDCSTAENARRRPPDPRHRRAHHRSRRRRRRLRQLAADRHGITPRARSRRVDILHLGSRCSGTSPELLRPTRLSSWS